MVDLRTMLNRVFEPVGKVLTPEVARRLIDLKLDDDVQQRLDDLLDRNAEGQITPDEKAELESVVAAVEFISILQAEARLLLARNTAA